MAWGLVEELKNCCVLDLLWSKTFLWQHAGLEVYGDNAVARHVPTKKELTSSILSIRSCQLAVGRELLPFVVLLMLYVLLFAVVYSVVFAALVSTLSWVVFRAVLVLFISASSGCKVTYRSCSQKKCPRTSDQHS